MEMGIEYIVRLIESKRAALDVSKNKLLRGICSTDTFTKIANGQGRKLDMDEYEAFLRRERIREGIKACIKGTGNLDDVKKRIEINKKESRSNAIRITIKDFRIENIKNYLYGEIEFLLITRLLCIKADMGGKETALAGYEGLLSIIDKNIYCNNEAMKFFSKIIYEALGIYMEEEQYGKASKLCQYAMGRLPDENKFRYLPEIYEMKARAEAHLLAAEKCYSDKVLNALYDERNTNTKNSMNPFGDMAWRSATYLACLISLTQNTDNIYEAIGKPSYYSNQVFFYSYKSVYNNKRLSGSGDSMKMKGWNDTILAVKDVVIVAVGKYTNSDDIYTDDVDLCQYLGHKKLNAFLPSYIRENVFQADKASSSTC